MRNPKHKILIPAAVSLLCLAAASCSNRPDGVLGDGKTAELLADLHIADAYNSVGDNGSSMGSMNNDSVRKLLRQSVLAKHGVTEAQFDTTMGWYGRNLDKYEDMYEQVMACIAEKKKALSNMEREPSRPTLWPYGNIQRLNAGENGVLLPFEIPGAKVAKGSKLIWEAKTINATKPLEIFMAVEYSDGSTGYILRNLMGAGRQNITLQTDSQKVVRKMYGYLRLKEPAMVLLDSVSLVAAPLNRTSYYEVNSVQTYGNKTTS